MRRLLRRLRPLGDDRGDVPGWVLITLMTAALVLVIWSFAGTLLADMFQAAMKSVTFG